MRYREYRRKCNEVKSKRARRIAAVSGHIGPYTCKKKETPEWSSSHEKYADAENADFIVKHGRGRSSTYLKKRYARVLRNGKNRNEVYSGASYKRASGDFWWDFS